MQPLSKLCTPRPSVFDAQRRDTVLDLTDLINGAIKPADFFAENYITDGMQVLLEQGFRRLEGKSDQGIFLLKQAMGGGKTHNLLALGLLAKHPEFRQQVMGRFFKPDPSLGPVKVVAFTGRESDAPLGIWGAIAEQLGKRDHFKDHYAPLRAPGQGAWRNLFAGESVLILLDELPPYLEAARATDVGDSTLANVTATALSNLLFAINREGCERVCLVLTDLILYHILRTRLFETLPGDQAIGEVAQAYAKAVRDARQMDITSESPEQFAGRIRDAYPFHPTIRDLYARFRANPGFQQTRGLIRLMRIVTARLWQSGAAGRKYLIAAHDVDLNDRETAAEITQINNTLTNAVAHDIASNGTAVAEVMDENLGTSDTSDAAKLLLMASLANVPNAVLGLSIPELVAYLCAPGRDLSRLKGDVLEKFATAAWYLHSNRDGKLY
ncbi:MAG: glycosyl transferase, partial [Chloroflexi bacterium]